MDKADHSGHRSRMREKYHKNGLDSFAPHEVLEILLYYAVPHRNTNDIAKRLIDRFGSLSCVLDAPMDMLMDAGLTENQATFLKLIPDVTRYYFCDRYDNPDKVLDVDTIAAYIADRFIGLEEQEHVLLLLTDKKSKELFCGFIAKGDFESAVMSTRTIVSTAMNYRATHAYLAHNHPSGMAVPSDTDIENTRKLKAALALVNVRLMDHYIVADHDCVSMALSNLM